MYTRISRDDEGDGLGVARQREDCERLSDLRGWAVAKVYQDNDVSAYKRNVRRPEFELMLSDLADGLIDGVVAYDLDRLARQPKDLERLIDLYDERRRRVFATVTNDVNLGTADGRTMARVMVAFANKSSHDASRRIQRKHLELARQGKPNGGPAPMAGRKTVARSTPLPRAIFVPLRSNSWPAYASALSARTGSAEAWGILAKGLPGSLITLWSAC
ncbi:recombinase family protein [Streptomyces sp. NBC_00588]|uniref:recombinase family protein n=1 Tax=Streptomyces sp. NBC_00588 TaxID=2975784 RepID=UPI002E801928|nr:recombinase family protein [Streptomyces sp. NBC_00588]WUB37266.1 recombinase family protein [Streptomyces sp. NBC_00588]